MHHLLGQAPKKWGRAGEPNHEDTSLLPRESQMIDPRYLNILREIYIRLVDRPICWVVTGSLGMALQGMEIEIHDIDIQTDKQGAYEFESLFAEYVVEPVRYLASERIRSYLGTFEIDGIKVEIMGDIQKMSPGQEWEPPVKVEQYRQWIRYNDMRVPVLSLEYEYQAYLKLGRTEKAETIRRWLVERDAPKKGAG